MSSRKSDISSSQIFQFRLTVEEWLTGQFEKVTIKYEGLLNLIDQVRFVGVNGLIQRENKNISPFYFELTPQKGENFLLIAFSIPIFQSLDSIAIQTCMEYFAAVLKHTLYIKNAVPDAEIEAFNDIKRLRTIMYNKREIIPYKDFTEKIEAQLQMKIRMGLPIVPIRAIKDKIENERRWNLEELRTAKNALTTVQSNLKEYSQQIAKKYRISVEPYLFQTNLENRFEPIIVPIFFFNSVNRTKESFSVFVITAGLIDRITPRQLEILLAHEIIFDLFKEKFSRGMIEREIFMILSQDKNDPEQMIEKELSKFFNHEEITDAQQIIRNHIEDLLGENYPVMALEF